MLRVIAFLFLLLLSLQPAGAETPGNTRLRIQLMTEPGLAPDHGVRRRIVEGKNIQAMIVIPDGIKREGSLLDPESVSVKWNDEEVERFVFYKSPHIAMVFALVDDDRVTTESQLSMTAQLIGSDDLDAGWRLPLTFTAEEMAERENRPIKMGRGLQVIDAAGEPIPDVYVFGQRREDLLTKTDENGRAILDAPARSSMETHFAWSPEHWTIHFDPISESVIELTPKKDNTFTHKVGIDLRDSEGKRVVPAILLVNDNYYQTYTAARRTELELQQDAENFIIVVAAGFLPERVVITPRDRRKRIVLREWAADE